VSIYEVQTFIKVLITKPRKKMSYDIIQFLLECSFPVFPSLKYIWECGGLTSMQHGTAGNGIEQSIALAEIIFTKI
jgi:hypothetical protein